MVRAHVQSSNATGKGFHLVLTINKKHAVTYVKITRQYRLTGIPIHAHPGSSESQRSYTGLD